MDNIIQNITSAIQRDDFRVALEQFAILQQTHPDHEDTHEIYGDIMYEMQNIDQALESYKKSISINPLNSSCIEKLAEIYEQNNELLSFFNVTKNLYRLNQKDNRAKEIYGRAAYIYGEHIKDSRLQEEGVNTIKEVFNDGAITDKGKDILSVYFYNKSISKWEKNEAGDLVVKSLGQLEYAQEYLNKSSRFVLQENKEVINGIKETQEYIKKMLKRGFVGYREFAKAGIILGFIFVIIGWKIFGWSSILLGILYYFSQFAPAYRKNLEEGREPFIIRRLIALDNFTSGVTFFDTNIGNVLLKKYFYQIFVKGVMYGMILIFLPYETIKGFLMNYRFKDVRNNFGAALELIKNKITNLTIASSKIEK